ncbi:MAG: HAMP domain-containing protein [Gammaproteobacteria bacterium]|nr:HAMP domain-containing protein [Gammaproteobacteria bacterium]
MFKRLSNKLIITLFGLLLLLSTAFIGFAVWSTPMFLQELNQKLNLGLAKNIVTEKELLVNHHVNQEALQSVFMGLMVVNPLIEVYLVDTDGKLLAYSAPPGVVKRDRIDLAPIKTFLSADRHLPVLGNDPRDVQRNKVFSAAEIRDNHKLQGYLYVVLGGQAYDSVVDMLQSSYMLRLWTGAIIVSLLIAGFAGFVLFRHITKRVQTLAHSMEQFKHSDFQQSVGLPARFDGRPGDEIDQLGITFREMSERIIQQVKQLQHNDTSRRELVANVSHDLRTPLASLQGYLETLALKGPQLSEDEKKHYINIAYQHSERLRKLISELFELSTLENQGARLHFEPFSMSELIQDVSQKFQLEAQGKNLQLSTHIPAQPAFVSADIGLIQRVLENLIENAIKYTPPGGQIGISLMHGQHTVATSISDTGHGIPEADLPHIFERFYRVDKHRDEDGTGLGLAIAKRIMQLHNSSIDVASRPNAGTTFSFQLPSAELSAHH